MEKFNKGQRYSDEDCVNMIKNMTYPVDAPSFVIKTIRAKRKNIERNIKSPEKEMDAAMEELGGIKRHNK